MSFPNLSSFRGVTFNEDTTSSQSQPADPEQQPDIGIEKATFSDITVIEAGGMGHTTLTIPILVEAANWAGIKAGRGQFGTLVQKSVTLSTAACLTSLTGGRKSPDSTFYRAQATWVW